MTPPAPLLERLPAFLRRYLCTRAISGPWSLEGCCADGFAAAVVVPALAEERHLFATLDALADQPHPLRSRVLAVVVINHRADTDPSMKEDNRRVLQRLQAGEGGGGMPLAWVDAASPGRELPPGQGVGLARKIGCDLALARLDWSAPPLLVFLDADTLIAPDYLPAIFRHFGTTREGGGILPFAHQTGATPAEEDAIVRYELFLRSYVLGLSLAGSPYAFHTVGSTIACRAEAYVRCGGMNRRLAGEDFYFLQQLAKTAGVAPVAGTAVRPSSRPSERTPFGTGRSVARQLAGEEGASFYHPQTFRILAAWLQGAQAILPAADGDRLLKAAEEADPQVARFLAAEGFPAAWERIRRTSRGDSLPKAFHGWFDALKTLRLIHHLCPFHPRCSPGEGIPPLMAWAGVTAASCAKEQLRIIRRMQGVSSENSRFT